MATITEETTSWLNRLLRGELSAVETYEQAMSKCEKEACAGARCQRWAPRHARLLMPGALARSR